MLDMVLGFAHLADVIVARDVLDEDVLCNTCVIGCIARLDVDWRVQNRHPALPILVQVCDKVLRKLQQSFET